MIEKCLRVVVWLGIAYGALGGIVSVDEADRTFFTAALISATLMFCFDVRRPKALPE